MARMPASDSPHDDPRNSTAEATAEPEVTSAGFVALSRFAVANGPDMTRKVKEAFRLHLVDDVPGFRRMDVISPLDDQSEIWLITYWTDEESFHSWHTSHQYGDSHKGIPRGLKLVRGSFQLRFFEHISS